MNRRIYIKLGQPGKPWRLAGQAEDIVRGAANKKPLVYQMGSLAILYVELGRKEQAFELVNDIIRTVQETNAKTSGLGEISGDLAMAGEPVPALQLVKIIREPHIKVEALTSLARSLGISGREADEETVKLIEGIAD